MQRIGWGLVTGLMVSTVGLTVGVGQSSPIALAQAAPDEGSAAIDEDPAVIDETLTTLESGLQYVELEVGAGAIAQPGYIVLVHYTGTLEDGTKFDSSFDRNWPFGFPLGAGRVIPGWEQGVAGMRVGGKRQLIIPPELAYGDAETGPIPANSTLIFEVELLGVTQPRPER